MKHKNRPTKYKKERKLKRWLFLTVLILSVAVWYMWTHPQIMAITNTETIRHDQELMDEVRTLREQVASLKEDVDNFEANEKAIKSWIEPLVDTNQELSDLVDSSQAQARELIEQNQKIMEQNKELLLTAKTYKSLAEKR